MNIVYNHSICRLSTNMLRYYANSFTHNHTTNVTKFSRYISHKPYPSIFPNKEAARTFLLQLEEKDRSMLNSQFNEFNKEIELSKGAYQPFKLSGAELYNVFLFNAFPFIGFGILDNFIMIVAGEYIDANLGMILGITTMAAAGIGNLISDVAGIGLAGYVEILVSKIGINIPNMTPQQANWWGTRLTVILGRTLGVSIGCIIGMFPLLFYHKPRKEEEAVDEAEKEELKVHLNEKTS